MFRFFASLALGATCLLGALSSCVGPDLEPPFSGNKDTAAPQAPVGGSTPTPSTPAGGAKASDSPASASGGRGAGTPGPTSGAAGTGAQPATAGAGGSAVDAGVSDEDAGVAPQP